MLARSQPGSGLRDGPAYTSRLTEFAANGWRPEVAASGRTAWAAPIDACDGPVGASYG